MERSRLDVRQLDELRGLLDLGCDREHAVGEDQGHPVPEDRDSRGDAHGLQRIPACQDEDGFHGALVHSETTRPADASIRL